MNSVVFAPGLRRLTNSVAMHRSHTSELLALLNEICGEYPQIAPILTELIDGADSSLRIFINQADVTSNINDSIPIAETDKVMIFHPVSGG